jgi:hypothetical protein
MSVNFSYTATQTLRSANQQPARSSGQNATKVPRQAPTQIREEPPLATAVRGGSPPGSVEEVLLSSLLLLLQQGWIELGVELGLQGRGQGHQGAIHHGSSHGRCHRQGSRGRAGALCLLQQHSPLTLALSPLSLQPLLPKSCLHGCHTVHSGIKRWAQCRALNNTLGSGNGPRCRDDGSGGWWSQGW